MANVKTKVTFISFQIQDNQTIATVEFESDAGTPWDGGKRIKSFPPEVSVSDILTEQIVPLEFMTWERAD